MTDDAGPSEAYHVLGQLNDGMAESRAELEKLRDQANHDHADLLKQLAEAQEAGDEASLERLPPLIEQAQQAWIVANEELGDDEQEDQPPDQEEDDDSQRRTDSALPTDRERRPPDNGPAGRREDEPDRPPEDGGGSSRREPGEAGGRVPPVDHEGVGEPGAGE